jgi:hypothetical protein
MFISPQCCTVLHGVQVLFIVHEVESMTEFGGILRQNLKAASAIYLGCHNLNMLASIVFITAVFGKYEKTAKLRHPQDIKADWICFTNNTKLISNGWQLDFTPYHLTHPSPLDDGRMINTYQNKSHPVHPFLAAKYYKQAFQNIPRLKSYDVVVWIDGTVEIKVPTVASFLMNKIMNQSYPMVGFHHEMRQGQMWPEVAASYAKKYNGENWLGWKQPVQDVMAQYRQYLRNGYNYAYWNRNRKRVKNASQHVS